MQPPGLARVEEARASGSWDKAYASAAIPRVTPDIRRALKTARLMEAWESCAPSHRLRYLYWINEAKRPETRAQRIAQLPTLVKERRLAGFNRA